MGRINDPTGSIEKSIDSYTVNEHTYEVLVVDLKTERCYFACTPQFIYARSEGRMRHANGHSHTVSTIQKTVEGRSRS